MSTCVATGCRRRAPKNRPFCYVHREAPPARRGGWISAHVRRERKARAKEGRAITVTLPDEAAVRRWLADGERTWAKRERSAWASAAAAAEKARGAGVVHWSPSTRPDPMKAICGAHARDGGTWSIFPEAVTCDRCRAVLALSA